MPPKALRGRGAAAKARAKVATRRAKNQKLDARRTALTQLNAIAEEVGVSRSLLQAPALVVERIPRILE